MTESAQVTEFEERPRRRRLAAAALGLVLLVLATAAGVGAAAVLLQREDTFASSAVLAIDQEPGLTLSTNDGLINKLVRLRLKYVDAVQTTTFSDELAVTTGLAPTRVHGALSAAAPPLSLLLRVTAKDTDPAVTERLAQAAAEQLRSDLEDVQSALGLRPGNRVTLTVVSPARSGVRTSPSERRSQLVGVVVGVGVLVAGLVVADVVRRRRRG